MLPSHPPGKTPSCLFQPLVVADKARHSLAGGSILLMSTSIFLWPSCLSSAILPFLTRTLVIGCRLVHNDLESLNYIGKDVFFQMRSHSRVLGSCFSGGWYPSVHSSIGTSPVVQWLRPPHFQCRSLSLIPGLGNKIPRAAWQKQKTQWTQSTTVFTVGARPRKS